MARLTNKGNPLTQDEIDAIKEDLQVDEVNASTVQASLADDPEGAQEAMNVPGLTAGKIDAEVLPDVVEFDYIRPGESFDGVYPEGAITRKGAIPFYHDNATPGGVQIGGGGSSGNRISGVNVSYPFGTTVGAITSTVEQASTRYYQELGRIIIPGADMVIGNRLSYTGTIRILSDTFGHTTNNSQLVFLKAADWDTKSGLSGLTPFQPHVRVFEKTDATDMEAKFWISMALESIGSTPLNPSVAPTSRGWDYTNNVAWASSYAAPYPISNNWTPGEDYEVVVAMRVLSTETRITTFDISATSVPW